MLPPELKFERERILQFALIRVSSGGWTEQTLQSATADAGFREVMARRAFPRGINDLIATYLSNADDAMLEALGNRNLNTMPIRDRIRTAIRVRLEQNSNHREAIRRLIALQSTPQHATAALFALHRTMDKIWRAADDKSTDFNFYTKRALLAGVYCTTTLFWLKDGSDGFLATWQFLDRRINDVMQLQTLRSRYDERLKSFEPAVVKFFQALTSRM